jgi:sortase (surface protein transpeptidase)
MRARSDERRSGHLSRPAVLAALAIGLVGSGATTQSLNLVRTPVRGVFALPNAAGQKSHTPKPPKARPSGVAGTPAPGQTSPDASAGSDPPELPLTPHPTGWWVEIPSIGVDASVINLGVNPDGTLEVPEDYDVAGWYSLGPKPGEVGPAVVVGHVDSQNGAAVFYRVRDLEPGVTITMWRGGQAYTFVVTAISQYPKDAFPTDKVYGPLDYPALRLVTCGGVFNQQTGHYTDNIIVFAKQQG